MAIYRNVQLSFWTDNKVEDDFTPEDKYFYIYLLTNPQTNICGCYEVSYSQMTRQTGYVKETIDRLLERFENVHNVIKYNQENKEVLILHWYKYNWSRSEKTLVGIENVAKHIKTEQFRDYVFMAINCIRDEKPVKEFQFSEQMTLDSLIAYEKNKPPKRTKRGAGNKEVIERIVKHLNDKCGTNYRADTDNTKKLIKARLSDGYSEQDFYTVINKKSDEWIGTEYEKHLCPDILFSEKFETYLNQKIVKGKGKNAKPNGFNDFPQRKYDYDELEKMLVSN